MSYKKAKRLSPSTSTSTTTPSPTLATSTFDRWCQIILSFLFILLFTFVPLFFTWFNEELFEFGKMLAVYVLTILIGSTWLIRSIWTQKIIFRRTFLDIPLLLFFISQLISTIFSIEPRTSVFGYYTRFNAGLLPLFCYIMLFYALVSNFDRRQLKKLLFANLGVSLVISTYGILEHFGHSFSCVLINFKQVLTGQVPFSQAFGVSCWVQLVQERVFATFGQPNWLATYLVTLLPINLGLIFLVSLPKNILNIAKKHRLWLWIAFVLMMMTLLFTKSRSGLLALAIGLVIFGLGWLVICWSRRQSSWSDFFKTYFNKTFVGVIVSVMAIVLLFGTPYTPNLQEIFTNLKYSTSQTNPSLSTDLPADQIESAGNPSPEAEDVPLSEAGGTESGEIRKIVWKGALDVWKRYPLFGSGLETFGYSYYLDRPMEHNLVSEWDFLYNKAHNEFLNYLATTGIIGLGTYLLLICWFIWHALKTTFNNKNDLSLRLFSLSLVAAMTAMMVANFFGFSTVFSNVLLFSILAFYVLAHVSTEEKNSVKIWTDPKNPELHLPLIGQWICTTAVAILACFTLVKTSNYWQADNSFFRGKSSIKQNTATSITNGLTLLQRATQLAPNEAMFHGELADIYSQIAVAYKKQGASTEQISLYVSQAEDEITTALKLNPAQLNLYKTALRVYLNLAQIDLNYMTQVQDVLHQAIAKSPTDAKLRYNLAIIYFNAGKSEAGLNLLREIVTDFKPNYHEARYYLAQRALEAGLYQEATDNYQYILEYIDPQDLRSINGLKAIATMSAQVDSPL